MNWNQALFPSLKRRDGCAIKKMSRSNLSSRRRGGQIGEIFRPEEFRRTDHPVCGASEACDFLLMPQPPLLFKEGNVSALKQSVTSFTRSMTGGSIRTTDWAIQPLLSQPAEDGDSRSALMAFLLLEDSWEDL